MIALLEPPVNTEPLLAETDFSAVTTYRTAYVAPLERAVGNEASRFAMKQVLHEGMFVHAPWVARELSSILDSAARCQYSETEIITRLRDCIQQETVANEVLSLCQADEQDRISRRVAQLTELLPVPQGFIDIGCGTGGITSALGKAWQLPRERVVGMDVYDRLEADARCSYYPMHDLETLSERKTLDTVLLLMVLHHEAEPEKLLTSIYDALPAEGTLCIRDHDVTDPDTRLFLEAFDRFYFSVLNGLEGVPQPANYKSASAWISLAEAAGFTLETIDYPEPDSPMQPVHLAFKKHLSK